MIRKDCSLNFFKKLTYMYIPHLLFPPKLLYTGDFSRQEDRHLMAAEIPSVKPDILIIV